MSFIFAYSEYSYCIRPCKSAVAGVLVVASSLETLLKLEASWRLATD